MSTYRLSLFGMQAGPEALRRLVEALRPVAATVAELACAPHAVAVAATVPAEVDRDRLERLVVAATAGLDLAHLVSLVVPRDPGPAWRCLVLADRQIPVQALAPVLDALTGQGLEPERCQVLSAEPDRAALALHGHGRPLDAMHLAGRLQAVAADLRLDACWHAGPPPSLPGLAVFDMDSTLIRCECIDELAAQAGSGPQVKAITEAAMRGELDFVASFVKRVSTLAGLPATALDDLAARVPVMPGLVRLARALKARGCRLAIASGGFAPVAESLQRRFGFDEVRSNRLEVADGRLTGRHLGGIVDGQAKRSCLRELADRYGVARDRILAVGDGANDLPMLAEAGLGVAFHAKPKVQEQAAWRLNHVGLDGILYLLGLDDAAIDT